MKKSLLAVAVLGAFAGTAMAADVTLYGVVDTGLMYTHTKQKNADGTSVKTNKFEMTSGKQAGSRWGLKGTEDLGNGYSVGFILESGFNSDTGMGNTQLFNRQSTLSISGPFGTVLAGRMGSVNQGTSSTGKIGMINAFGTSYSDYSANAVGVFVAGKVLPNMLTYQSPKFAGLQVHVQYGMSKDDKDHDGAYENKARKTDRYAALAATYNAGALNLYGAVDATNYKHEKDEKNATATTYTFGGNYDFGFMKLFGGVQYFDKVHSDDKAFKGSKIFTGKFKGWGAQVSASVPVAGGSLLAGVGYMDGKKAKGETDEKNDINRIRASVGYSYPLSKRTNVYAAAGFGRDECKKSDKTKYDYATAMVGLRHNF